MEDFECIKLQNGNVKVIILYKTYAISQDDALRFAGSLIEENR